MLANNISESFNQYIKEARDKPIITMKEMIRRQLMSRFEAKRSWIETSNGIICPKIQSTLKELKKKARAAFVKGEMLLMQRMSTSYGNVYFASGVANSRGNDATVQPGPSQGSSNMFSTQTSVITQSSSQVPSSTPNFAMPLDGHAAF
ncbi:hypothetical protein Vadar_014300 [Vaccinium darrowii]|uniref:Uncharacterized protein n=1 Tax=Vaccinium darrowii TaxID=229202 RepID=A0ACB7XHF8_9ERIC|nr:hypothetical protein Vadar_014300 [Vaccinium darrowii]